MDYQNCKQKNCDNASRTKGLCPRHYSQKRLGYEDHKGFGTEVKPCAVSHCDIEAQSMTEGALCEEHYQLKYRGFDPESRIIDLTDNPKKRSHAKCLVPDCVKRQVYGGVCSYHRRRINTGKVTPPQGCTIKPNPPCSFEGCSNLQETLKTGLCHSHICQLQEGRELTPLRDYKKYEKGQTPCAIATCRSIAISRSLCTRHLSAASTYKLTTAELEKLLAVGKCQNPGCGATKRLHIDHDHETGKVRGLLCGGCNTALGHLKEDVDRIRGLADYKLMHEC